MKVTIQDETRGLFAAVQKATITSLAHAAAYIRKAAVNSIRRGKKPSDPGSPPRSRTGVLKRGIAYAVEPGSQQAVIGPTRSAVGLIAHSHEFGGSEPPKVATRSGRFDLEIGGFGPIRNLSDSFGVLASSGVWKKGDKLLIVTLRTARQVEAARRIAAQIPPSEGGLPSKRWRKYPPRPFMGPALMRSKERLPGFWANSIKGG